MTPYGRMIDSGSELFGEFPQLAFRPHISVVRVLGLRTGGRFRFCLLPLANLPQG